jgi:hypothetical protein
MCHAVLRTMLQPLMIRDSVCRALQRSQYMRKSPSIVPQDDDQEIYSVLDDFGRLGHAWREADAAGCVQWLARAVPTTGARPAFGAGILPRINIPRRHSALEHIP